MWWLDWISDLVFPPRSHALLVRSATLPDLLLHNAPVPVHEGVALFPFRTPLIRALITEAKFKGNTRAQMLLGQAVREFIGEWLDDVNGLEQRPVALIPIPLSKKRFRERGYNQVTEIARHAVVGNDIELMTHVLSRTRDTRAQTTLGKEARKENLSGAFASQPLNPAFLYIVIDDVRTTGATLADAVRALQNAGAVRVVSLAVAY